MKVRSVMGIDLVPTAKEKPTFRLAPFCIDSDYEKYGSNSYLWITTLLSQITFPYFTKEEIENGKRSS